MNKLPPIEKRYRENAQNFRQKPFQYLCSESYYFSPLPLSLYLHFLSEEAELCEDRERWVPGRRIEIKPNISVVVRSLLYEEDITSFVRGREKERESVKG